MLIQNYRSVAYDEIHTEMDKTGKGFNAARKQLLARRRSEALDAAVNSAKTFDDLKEIIKEFLN